ncbi:MAG: SMC-Scp complex subunit ScpB [bacterium]
MNKTKSQIESLLFTLTDPIDIKKLAGYAKIMVPECETALKEIAVEYEEQNRGVRILQRGRMVQMVTAADNAKIAEQIVKSELSEGLSNAALETLSIILYRGPISRAEIEAVRGVNCTFILRNLLMRGLVEHKKSVRDARMWEYEVTFEYLQHLGITKVSELPNYEELSKREEFDNALEKYSALIDQSEEENQIEENKTEVSSEENSLEEKGEENVAEKNREEISKTEGGEDHDS